MTKSVAIIPARGGSKRVPRKNIKLFHGKPLIAYSIEAALRSELFDKIIVSTDDEEIAKTAKKYGAEVPFLRPKELSDDYTGTGAVVSHALRYLKEKGFEYDFCCTIYATAPLIDEKYIKQGFFKLKKSDASRAFSVTSMPFPIQRTFKITENDRCQMFWPENITKRSQDLEEAYQDAGQFYWQNMNKKSKDITFGQDSIPIVLPRYLVQDIDTLEDWETAEFLYEAVIKNRKNILFRVDSSSDIGIGHLMRDLVLAEEYKKDKIFFASLNLEGNFNEKILEKGYDLKELNTNNVDEIIGLIKKLKIDFMIIDHYGIDVNYEKRVKEETKVKLLVFDDLYEKHYCDILLNHNICAKKERYKTLVPNFTELRCGKDYTLIREEFKEERKKGKKNDFDEKHIKVFLAMGGADHSNININILDVLNKFSNLKIDVVTTTANKNIEKLKDYSKKYKNIKIYINSNNIASLINCCDFAIISPSVIAHEVLFLKTPFIAIKTALNQQDMYEYLLTNNYDVLEKFDTIKLEKTVEKKIKSLKEK